MARSKGLREAVFAAIAGSLKRSLRESSDPVIHQLLRPFDARGYPVEQIHDFSRVQKSAQFPSLNNIAARLEKLPAVQKALRARGSRARSALMRMADEALEFRAARAYAEEWENLSPEQIRRVVNASGGWPEKANELNSDRVVAAIRSKLKTQARYRLLDVGSGGGGTVLPVVAKLSPAERARLDVVIQDIMPAGLQFAQKELIKAGLEPGQIRRIECNFFDFQLLDPRRRPPPGYSGNVSRLKALAGKLDGVTSFAAIHHMRDTELLQSL